MVDTNRVNFSTWAFWSFALTVALLPIGLGGNRPIPVGLAQAGLAISCLCLALSTDIWQNVRFFRRLHWALGLLAIVLIWVLIQTQPFVPEDWKHPLWQEAAGVLNLPVRGAISVSPEDSLKGMTHLLTYISCGLLAYILAQDANRAMQMVRIFWYSGVIVCIYGLIVYVAGLHTILWFPKWAYEDDLTATFVNHNHFAIYAGMVLVCGTALLMRSWVNDVGRKKEHQRIEALRDWLLEKGFPQGFLWVLVLMSIIFSHSRAGLFLAVAGVGAYLFFFQLYIRAWKRAALIGFLALLIPVVVVAIAMQSSDRFAVLFNDYSSLDRVKVYKLGWHALMDNLWLGYGLNGFEPEFRLYQQYMIMEFNHAHNDLLESLLDLGVPVGLMLWSAIGLLLSGLVRGIFRRRQNGMFPALGLSVSLMVLGHGLVDFSLQIPGVVLFWTALMGAGLAQSWGQSDRARVAAAE